MDKQSICRCVIASVLSITATSWAQTSVGLGRADFKDNCASCHGAAGTGDGPVHSFLVKPPADLTTISQRHGGKFPQELVWEVIDEKSEDELERLRSCKVAVTSSYTGLFPEFLCAWRLFC